MTINKNSWHYKMNFKESEYGEMPKSLCGYFWLTVWNCLKRAFLWSFFIFCVGFILFTAIGGWFTTELFWPAVLIWSIVAIVGIIFLISNIRLPQREKPTKKYIVTEYMKAVKRKVCPLITYK